MSYLNPHNAYPFNTPVRSTAQDDDRLHISLPREGIDTPDTWNPPLQFPLRFFGRPPIGLPYRSPTLPPPRLDDMTFSQGFNALPSATAPAIAVCPATPALAAPVSPSSPRSQRQSPRQPRIQELHAQCYIPTGISPNYCGNRDLMTNWSALVPDELNTSLWLTNLPPDCDHRMLLGAVRGCGKVYATVVNPPVASQSHITAASKLVFFEVAGARELMRQAREGLFAVGGYIPRVRHNRIRSEARPRGPQSRVLHIEGPDRIVNLSFLTAFFAERFKYELEGIVVLGRFGDRARLEWRFGSYRCQAESARASIAREKERVCGGSAGGIYVGQHFYESQDALERQLAWQSVTVHFAVDPCSIPLVGPRLSDEVEQY